MVSNSSILDINNQNDDLFELINSLTANEKRYIMLKASLQKGKKNHMVVFNFLTKSKKDTKRTLSEFWKQQNIKTPLFRVKHYLYQFILRSLHDFQSDPSIDQQLLHYLLEIEFLFHKKLYDRCMAHINKAEVLAQSSDNFIDLIKIAYWKNKVSINSNVHLMQERKEKKTDVKALIRHSSDLINTQELLKSIKKIAKQRATFSSEELNQELDQLIITINKQQANCPSKLIQSILYQCFEWYHIAKQQHEFAIEYQLKNIAFIEMSPILEQKFEEERLVILGNAAILSCSIIDADSFQKAKSSFKKLHLKNGLEQLAIKFYYAEATLLVRQKKYDDAASFLLSHEHIYTTNINYCPKELIIATTLMHITIYHYTNNFDSALYWLNTIIHHKDYLKDVNIFDITMFAEILIHYDAKNFKLASSLITNFRRKFKYKSFAPIYKIFFNGLLRSIKHVENAEKQLPIFQKIKIDIEQQLQEGLQYDVSHLHIDLFEWLDRKITSIDNNN